MRKNISPKNALAEKAVVAPKEKEGNRFMRFLHWLLPWKGDRTKTIVFKSIFLVCIAAFLVSGGLLLDYYIKDMTAGSEYDELQDLKRGSSSSSASAQLPADYSEDFWALYEKNPQICGWVEIPGTGIDYPVVQGKDNDYYLNHTFTNSYSTAGAPFLDYRNNFTEAGMSANSIIYAHNLNSGRMFHNLINYKNVSYYKEHPVVSYDTVYAEHDYKILGMFFVNADMTQADSFPYHMFIEKKSDAEFYQLINQAMQRSFFTTGVDVNPNDKLLMLSTCDNAFDNSRLVLVARMVRPGESADVDVSKAQKNAKQYLPQNYTNKMGGTYRELDPNYSFYSAK